MLLFTPSLHSLIHQILPKPKEGKNKVFWVTSVSCQTWWRSLVQPCPMIPTKHTWVEHYSCWTKENVKGKGVGPGTSQSWSLDHESLWEVHGESRELLNAQLEVAVKAKCVHPRGMWQPRNKSSLLSPASQLRRKGFPSGYKWAKDSRCTPVSG